MEVSEIRRRLQQVIRDVKRAESEKRVESDAASKAYEIFLPRTALPVFRTLAGALTAEGYPFRVSTPATGVRLASEHAPEDFLEIELDTSGAITQVIGRVNRRRGGRVDRRETPVREGATVEHLTEEDVLSFALAAVADLLER
jgi:hypothetical protein